MCLILFSYQANDEFPLVVAANRDERFQRATRLAQFWPETPSLLAGQDLEAGGTWLGITRNGRFAAITNFRGLSATQTSNPLSRGHLTSQFLLSTQAASDYAESTLSRGSQYQGFNLLLFDGKHFVYCNNLNQTQSIMTVEPGIYGLSNGLLDAPWPKIEKGKQALNRLIHNKTAPLHTEDLLALLRDDQFAEENTLPNTGVNRDLERRLSPLFISSSDPEGSLNGYGTCNSTAIIIDRQRQVNFHERSFYQPPLQQNPIDQKVHFMLE